MEGTYSIPVDRTSYIEGEGVLYALLMETTDYVRLPRSYNREEIEAVVDALERDVKSVDDPIDW